MYLRILFSSFFLQKSSICRKILEYLLPKEIWLYGILFMKNTPENRINNIKLQMYSKPFFCLRVELLYSNRAVNKAKSIGKCFFEDNFSTDA